MPVAVVGAAILSDDRKAAALWRDRYYALERGRTSYTSNLGLLKLREAISTHLERNFRVHYAPGNEILIAVGVSEALDIALRAVLNPGDTCTVPADLMHTAVPAMTGEASLYHIVATDDAAGPTWKGAEA